MAKPWDKRRDSVIGGMLNFAVLLGVSNHLYDPAKQQLIYSPGAYVYRICLHLAACIVIAMGYGQLQSFLVHLIGEKVFLWQLTLVLLYEHIVIFVFILIAEWRNRGRATQPLNELLAIRTEDLGNAEELGRLQRHTLKLFFLKATLVVIYVLTSFLTLMFQCRSSQLLIALTVGSFVLQIDVVGFHQQFTISVLYGGYLFKALNLRLSQVVDEINVSLKRKELRRLTQELNRIGVLHTRLLNLVTSIKDLDQLQLLVMFVSSFFFQVCALFYLLLRLRGVFGEFTLTGLFYAIGFTGLSTIDMLVGLHICGECVKACDAAEDTLNRLNLFVDLDSSLERDVDVLSFQFAREKLHLTIYGLFELDANIGPKVLMAIVMHIILLTQIAYDEVQ